MPSSALESGVYSLSSLAAQFSEFFNVVGPSQGGGCSQASCRMSSNGIGEVTLTDSRATLEIYSVGSQCITGKITGFQIQYFPIRPTTTAHSSRAAASTRYQTSTRTNSSKPQRGTDGRSQTRGVSMETREGAATVGSRLASYLLDQLTWFLHWVSCCWYDLPCQWLQVGLRSMWVQYVTMSSVWEGLNDDSAPPMIVALF